MVYIVMAVIGMFIVYLGFMMVTSGKWVGRYNPKYTVQSMDAFSKPAGVLQIILGLVEICLCVGFWGGFPQEIIDVLIGALVFDIIGYLVAMKMFLIKR